MTRPCARCGHQPRAEHSAYCRGCRNAYMADYMSRWRKTHPLAGEALVRQNARDIVGKAFKRGTVATMPCARCSAAGQVRHHPDYGKPREIVWLCRPCHTQVHRELGTWKKKSTA